MYEIKRSGFELLLAKSNRKSFTSWTSSDGDFKGNLIRFESFELWELRYIFWIHLSGSFYVTFSERFQMGFSDSVKISINLQERTQPTGLERLYDYRKPCIASSCREETKNVLFLFLCLLKKKVSALLLFSFRSRRKLKGENNFSTHQRVQSLRNKEICTYQISPYLGSILQGPNLEIKPLKTGITITFKKKEELNAYDKLQQKHPKFRKKVFLD